MLASLLATASCDSPAACDACDSLAIACVACCVACLRCLAWLRFCLGLRQQGLVKASVFNSLQSAYIAECVIILTWARHWGQEIRRLGQRQRSPPATPALSWIGPGDRAIAGVAGVGDDDSDRKQEEARKSQGSFIIIKGLSLMVSLFWNRFLAAFSRQNERTFLLFIVSQISSIRGTFAGFLAERPSLLFFSLIRLEG